MDFKMAELFLSLLEPGQTRFTFQAFHPNRKVIPSDPMHGTFDEWKDSLAQYNRDGYGIFVTINKTDLKGRKIKNITHIRAFWQEDDGEGLKLPIEPDLIVETSPGKFHRYYFVKLVKLDKKEFDAVQRSIVQNYGSDKNARDITRVLRLPGFYNTKPNLDEPYRVGIRKIRNKGKKQKRRPWEKIRKKIGYIYKSKKKEVSDFDSYDAIEEISEAKSYYQPMVSWSMRMANQRIPENAIKAILETSLKLGLKKRPDQDMDIWQERFDAIDQMVGSAVDKVHEEGKVRSEIYEAASLRESLMSGVQIMEKEIEPVKYLIEPIITVLIWSMLQEAWARHFSA